MRPSSPDGGDELAGRLAHGFRAVGAGHLGQPPLDGRRSCACASASIDADPHHLHGVARELDQPDDRVDVGPVLEEGNHRNALFGLGTEDQASQADQLLRQASGLQDQPGHLADGGVLVVQPLEQHFVGQKQVALRERAERLFPDVGACGSST